MTTRPKSRIAIIGAGRVGLGLGGALKRCGYTLTGVLSRRPAAARRASRLLGDRIGTRSLSRALHGASVVLICVPDDAIPAVVSRLASELTRGVSALHTGGALGPAPLAPLRAHGVAVGTIHPLTSFPAPRAEPLDLQGVTFALDGDPPALREAAGLVRRLGGVRLSVPADSHAVYHLAAVILANDLVALLDTGLDLAARRLGIGPEKARAAFLPLVRASIENVARSGPRRALTGPITRGDVRTLQRHRKALLGESDDLVELHRLLSRHAVEMARADGRLDPETSANLLRLLARTTSHEH
ncbi:MAG: Rossmann-like and DUF2520 domain-containing protein [Acidobacteriota bacterium]